MNANVSIIILNWNGWKDTIECLESLYKIDYLNFEIIIVDNASEDQSVAKIKKYTEIKLEINSKFFYNNPENIAKRIKNYKKNVKNKNNKKPIILLKNDENYGFAEGNNIGIKFSLYYLNPDYIFLLNNDTVVKNNFLSELIKVAQQENNIGIVGSKICYYDDPQKIWSSDCNIGWWTSYLSTKNSDTVKETDWVSGCGLLIKKELINKISFLDSELFFGWEDIDYCIRAKNADYRVFYNPESIIWHKVSKSRKKRYKNNFSPYYNRFKARFQFLKVLKKYSSKYQQIFQLIFFIIVYTPFLLLILPLYELMIENSYLFLLKKLEILIKTIHK
ncbi:MAG: glycosyltransferase family 2 protein [Methanobacteriaceae archaeon]